MQDQVARVLAAFLRERDRLELVGQVVPERPPQAQVRVVARQGVEDHPQRRERRRLLGAELFGHALGRRRHFDAHLVIVPGDLADARRL
jgi:hypothetical protein